MQLSTPTTEQQYTIQQFLQHQIAPTLGCTEPVAVALGAAAAASLLPEDESVREIRVRVDPGVFKNGLGVLIPGTGGLRGLALASALGALSGDPAHGLELLQDITPEGLAAARALVERGAVDVALLDDAEALFIQTEIRTSRRSCESLIRDRHDNLVSLACQGREVPSELLQPKNEDQEEGGAGGMDRWLQGLSMETILGMLGELGPQDLDFLRRGVEMNMALAEYGLAHAPGHGVGAGLAALQEEDGADWDMERTAQIWTAAAADARMAGVNLPAMSSAGSGNNGLTAVLPLYAVQRFVSCPRDRLWESVCLSHLINAMIKAHLGRLSAVCSCSVAAGSGAAAGIARILGGDGETISASVTNVVEDLAGVLCDGAKPACALKLATAAGCAVRSARLAQLGVRIPSSEGIAGDSLERTLHHLGRLGQSGFTQLNRAILDTMLNKDRS
ncbi:MAG: L-serine ammonia-lyase, iron-sulfur-dependent, subunit alpha [Desulfohalobiaceae bacterium]|nr:L-serine ammonia-lyase, iron-sulfur-dependent, subunit alpha [Desulfohalobiaceae bacterium]